MNNFAGCIEGATVNTGASDLKSRKTNGSEPSLVGGVGVPALGTLTITGSNMHRGIEMPVAQPYFSSRSRMGKRESDAHVRGAAVAQRLHSATFGGGETRHENARASKIGGSMKLRHPASNLFMKYLIMLVIGASVSYGQQFSGTGYNLNNGEFLIIRGTIDSTVDSNQVHRERMARYRQMNAELSASINAMRAEAEMANQTRELREQTELLRKIANE
jgi:hypothetical protein